MRQLRTPLGDGGRGRAGCVGQRGAAWAGEGGPPGTEALRRSPTCSAGRLSACEGDSARAFAERHWRPRLGGLAVQVLLHLRTAPTCAHAPKDACIHPSSHTYTNLCACACVPSLSCSFPPHPHPTSIPSHPYAKRMNTDLFPKMLKRGVHFAKCCRAEGGGVGFVGREALSTPRRF